VRCPLNYQHLPPPHNRSLILSHSLGQYNPAGRLNALAHTSLGLNYGYGYNPASQVTQRSTSNDAYVYTGDVNVNRNYAVNGRNQYISAGPATFGYDANGNLTSDGASSFVYDVENRLVSRTGAATANLRYDPLGRLYFDRRVPNETI
jgi:hypothetical protein